MRWRSSLLCSLFLLASACGDSVVDGDHRGEPYLRLHGSFFGSTGHDANVRSAKLGIAWYHPFAFGPTVPQLTPILTSPLSSEFSFAVWDLPPASTIVSFCGARLALGLILVYDDVDDNGRVGMQLAEDAIRIEPPDRVLGMGVNSWLIYAATPLRDCPDLPDVDAGLYVLVPDPNDWLRLRAVKNASVEIELFPPRNHIPIISPGYDDSDFQFDETF